MYETVFSKINNNNNNNNEFIKYIIYYININKVKLGNIYLNYY